MPRQSKGVIASACRDHSRRPLIFPQQLLNSIPCPALFEAACELPKFALEINIRADDLAEKVRLYAWRSYDARPDRHVGTRNVAEGNGE